MNGPLNAYRFGAAVDLGREGRAMKKLARPLPVPIAFDDHDLMVLQDALTKYAENEVPRLLEGEIKHLLSLEQRFAKARKVIGLEGDAIEIRATLAESPLPQRWRVGLEEAT